jgi:hypothetical protein
MPDAPEVDRKKAMLYDYLDRGLQGDTGGARTISAPPRTTINNNGSGSKTDVTWRDTYELVNDLLIKAKSTGGSVQFVDLPSDAQTALASKVRANPKWDKVDDTDIAIAWYDDVPWVIVAEVDMSDINAVGKKKWVRAVKADPQLFNIPSNRAFGQKAQAASERKYGNSGGSAGGSTPASGKPAQGSGLLY